MNFLSPLAPACRPASCLWPHSSFWLLWLGGLGFFSSAALSVVGAISVPQTQLICPQKTRHRAYPPLEKPTWGASGGSPPLPWALMAFKAPFHPNFLTREQLCCSQSVVAIRSGMNWELPQHPPTAQREFRGFSSLPSKPLTIQALVATRAPGEDPNIPVTPVCFGACFHYLIKTFSGSSTEKSCLSLNLNFPTNIFFKHVALEYSKPTNITFPFHRHSFTSCAKRFIREPYHSHANWKISFLIISHLYKFFRSPLFYYKMYSGCLDFISNRRGAEKLCISSVNIFMRLGASP